MEVPMPLDGTVTPEDIQGLKTDLGKVSDDVKNFATDILAKVQAGQAVSDELKEKADKALSEQGDLRARLDEIDQKLLRRGPATGDGRAMTPGEIFTADERVKAFCSARERGRVRVDMAAITTGSAGA